MPTEKELMLKQVDAETTYQKKLTAGTNITIDPVTNVISSAGGGSTVQYTDNVPNGESVGILAINGQSHPIRIPKLAEGTGITITKNITTNVYTISLSGGGGGTTKTYMGKTNPDELVGEDGDLYFKYHKIETDVPTELTLPSLPDDATVPFPITDFNSYDSFTFYYTDGNNEPHNRKVNTGDLVISDSPADESPNSNIYTWNSYRYVQATRSTNGEGLVLRACGNCLYKLEANITEVDLGIDKSYAKVEDTWLPSGEQVEANPEETSQTPLTKIKIDGVTYYIAAGGSAEIVPLTKAEWDALPASKYTDNILYLITDSFTTDTIITPNPEGEATDTLTKLQIDETIYSLAGESGAAAIEKTQSEYNELTPAQKENGAIYMVQDDGGIGNYEYHTNQAETIVVRVNKTTDEIEWFFVDYTFTGGSVEQIPSELIAYLPASTISGNAYDTSLQTMMGYVAINAQGGFGLYPTDYSREISGTVKCLLKNTDGTEQANTYTDPYEGTGNAVNRIYYMGTEYANTNGGSGGGGDGYTEIVLWSGTATASNTILALSDSITNYDDLLIYGATIFDSNGTITTQLNTTQIIPVSQIEYGVADEITKGYMYNVSHGQAIRRAVMIFTDASHFVVSRGGENDTTECGFTKVVGIKYGSGGGSEPADLKPFVFDETEYKVGEWIDGKTIYQKTIELSSPITIADTPSEISWGSDIANIENIIGAVIHRRTEDTTYGSATSTVMARKSNGKILLYNGVSFSDAKFVTLQYTRTVDNDSPWHTINVGGGGGGTSEGEGIEIYSEDEYIVGKWVDGKKLYQKTFYYTHNDTIGDGYTTIASLSDVDYFEFVECSLYNPNDKRSYALSYAYGSKTTALTYDNGDIKLRVNSDTWNANWDVVITVRYTKTVETDAPAWGGSVNNYYANFIDTDNVIQAFTQISDTSEHTYTATEDCIVTYYVASQGDTYIKINNVLVGGNYSQGVGALGGFVAVKKGQTFSFQQSYTDSSSSGYTVYGVSYGSGSSSSESSVHYSTTEQVIGTWIDGKPLYQKTYENLNIGTAQNYTLTLSDLQNIEYFRVVPEGSQVSVSVPFPYIHYGTQNLVGYFTDITNGVPSLEIRKGSEATSFSNLQFLTIQYTKTTD